MCKPIVLDPVVFIAIVSFCCWQAQLVLLHVGTKTQDNFLSVFVFEEAEEVKI